jgi:dolichol-phosphate mannosyltransferase
VLDVPMAAVYNTEQSSLNVNKAVVVFGFKHVKNFVKRIFYNYFLRDFSVASVEWLLGPALLLFGLVFGLQNWMLSIEVGVPATAGTVMLAALPTIVGLQLVLSAMSFDIDNQPSSPLHRLLSD